MTDGDMKRLLDAEPLPIPVTVKTLDYVYDGWLVFAGEKRSGAMRVVVEDDLGRLAVHHPQHVRIR